MGKTKKKRLSPAETVVYKFGGFRPLARKLEEVGVSITAGGIHHWCTGDGLVPPRLHQPLFTLAKLHKVKLTADNLVNGMEL